MQAFSTAVVLSLLLFTTSEAIAQTPKVVDKIERVLALKRLQGEWVPELRVTTRGAEAYPLGGRLLVFDGETFTRFEARQAVAIGKFRIEDGFLRLAVESSNPWDLEAADTRKNLQYAYRVDGDLLTLCYTVGDKGKADDLTPGEGRQVVVYKRQRAKAKAPAGQR